MEDVAATATREMALKFINSTSVATESDIRQGINVGREKVIAYHFGERLGFSILNDERALRQIEDHVSVQVIADHVVGSWHFLRQLLFECLAEGLTQHGNDVEKRA